MNKKKSFTKRILNRIFHLMARFSPGAETIRPYLHRLRGVRIYGHIFIGDDVYLENEYPECVEIHDGAQIVLRTILLSHFRGSGKIIIGKNVWIGPNCVIAASPGQILYVGEGAVVAASSVVTKNVEPNTFIGGAPAKPIARVTVPMTLHTSYEDFKKGLMPL